MRSVRRTFSRGEPNQVKNEEWHDHRPGHNNDDNKQPNNDNSKMYMAKAAPSVEPAIAAAAGNTDEAFVEAAVPSEAPQVEPATVTDETTRTETISGNDKHGDSGAPTAVATVQPVTSAGVLRVSADFAGDAAVLTGAPDKNVLKRFLPLLFDERDFVTYGEVLRFVVIKGGCIFVFAEQTSLSPLYGIPLETVRPVMEDPSKPDKASVTVSPTFRGRTNGAMTTVLLKYRDNKQAFQFTFDTSKDLSLAHRFYEVVKKGSGSKGVAAAATRSKGTSASTDGGVVMATALPAAVEKKV